MTNRIKYFASICVVLFVSVFIPIVAHGHSEGNVATVSKESTYVKGITAARARSLVGVILGVVSIGIGWGAKRQTRQTGITVKNTRWSITALILGIVTMLLSIAHLIGTSGGFGTGGGKAGAIVALLSGVIGAMFGIAGLRLNRKLGGS